MWCAICVPSIREADTMNSASHKIEYNAFMRGLRTKEGQESVAANKGTKGDLFKIWMDPSCRIRNKGGLESKPGGLLYETSAPDKPTKSLSNSVVATTRARSSNRAVDLRALGIVRETRFACPGPREKLHAGNVGLAQSAHEQSHKRKRLSTGTLLLTPSLVRCPGCTGVPQENR